MSLLEWVKRLDPLWINTFIFGILSNSQFFQVFSTSESVIQNVIICDVWTTIVAMCYFFEKLRAAGKKDIFFVIKLFFSERHQKIVFFCCCCCCCCYCCKWCYCCCYCCCCCCCCYCFKAATITVQKIGFGQKISWFPKWSSS